MNVIKNLFQQKNIDPVIDSDIISGTPLVQILVSTIEEMSDGCQIIDFDYKHLYVNKSLVKQSQTTKTNLIGHTMMEVYPGIEQTQSFSVIKEAMENRHFIKDETEFTFPNGTKTWFEIRIEPVDVGLIIFSIDISKRKEYEKSLILKNEELDVMNKEHEESSRTYAKLLSELERVNRKNDIEKVRYEAMLECMGEGVFAVDKENHFILINKKAEEIMGVDAKALVTSQGSPSDIDLQLENGQPIPTEQRPTHIAIVNGKTLKNDNFVLARKDGKKYPISLTVTPIKLEGEIIGAIDVFRDITIEKEIDKSKTEFVSLASHQLRTPLGITKWYIETLISEGYIKKSPAAVKENIQEITRNNERLLELVRNLLSVSRIDEGRVRDIPKPTNLLSVIKDVVKQLQKVYTKKELKFSIKSDKKVPLLNLDTTRVIEVFENLISNAVKYNKYKGIVDIEIRVELEKVIIEIKDSGIGIRKEDLDHIFTKFFRSENAVTNNPEGSGLGLYVAKSYIESWGGSINVQSTLNVGSTFSIILPINPI